MFYCFSNRWNLPKDGGLNRSSDSEISNTVQIGIRSYLCHSQVKVIKVVRFCDGQQH
jgi:hypothetical protein